jgi:hypothetical protein
MFELRGRASLGRNVLFLAPTELAVGLGLEESPSSASLDVSSPRSRSPRSEGGSPAGQTPFDHSALNHSSHLRLHVNPNRDAAGARRAARSPVAAAVRSGERSGEHRQKVGSIGSEALLERSSCYAPFHTKWVTHGVEVHKIESLTIWFAHLRNCTARSFSILNPTAMMA